MQSRTRLVKASYKTGTYIGIAEQEKDGKVLVEIRSVVKHPMQGDLHQPKQANVPFFHERKALAYREKAWMPASTVSDFQGAEGDYKESLIHAVNQQISLLEQDSSEWSRKSLTLLSHLKEGYHQL